jgi:hypothetical protein
MQVLMLQIAHGFAHQGWLLRSGGAEGADSAFEQGCDMAGGPKEIYLPWKRFNGNHSPLVLPFDNEEEAQAITRRHHPAYHNLTQGGRKLMTRNAYQILGRNLNDPVTLVVCWTPGGQMKGSTAQAIRMAHSMKIPVLNLADYEPEESLELLDKFFLEHNVPT